MSQVPTQPPMIQIGVEKSSMSLSARPMPQDSQVTAMMTRAATVARASRLACRIFAA